MGERIGQFLIRRRLIAQRQLDEAVNAQLIYGGRLGTNLVELGHLDIDALSGALSEFHRVPSAPLAELDDTPDAVTQKLKDTVAGRFKAVPFGYEGRRLKVAVCDPLDPETIDGLSFATGLRIVPFVCPELRVYFYLERRYGVVRDARYIRIAEDRPVHPATLAPRPERGPATTSGVVHADRDSLFGEADPGRYLGAEDDESAPGIQQTPHPAPPPPAPPPPAPPHPAPEPSPAESSSSGAYVFVRQPGPAATASRPSAPSGLRAAPVPSTRPSVASTPSALKARPMPAAPSLPPPSEAPSRPAAAHHASHAASPSALHARPMPSATQPQVQAAVSVPMRALAPSPAGPAHTAAVTGSPSALHGKPMPSAPLQSSEPSWGEAIERATTASGAASTSALQGAGPAASPSGLAHAPAPGAAAPAVDATAAAPLDAARQPSPPLAIPSGSGVTAPPSGVAADALPPIEILPDSAFITAPSGLATDALPAIEILPDSAITTAPSGLATDALPPVEILPGSAVAATPSGIAAEVLANVDFLPASAITSSPPAEASDAAASPLPAPTQGTVGRDPAADDAAFSETIISPTPPAMTLLAEADPPEATTSGVGASAAPDAHTPFASCTREEAVAARVLESCAGLFGRALIWVERLGVILLWRGYGDGADSGVLASLRLDAGEPSLFHALVGTRTVTRAENDLDELLFTALPEMPATTLAATVHGFTEPAFFVTVDDGSQPLGEADAEFLTVLCAHASDAVRRIRKERVARAQASA